MIIRLPKDIFQFSLSFSPVKRALIRIKGVDATKFLHGLCTNNIQKLADDPKANGIPALFLNSIVIKLLFLFFYISHSLTIFLYSLI